MVSAFPSSKPDSRLGRKASPIAQGRLEMDAIVVGIDASKDKLDIAVLPQGETFATSRDAKELKPKVGDGMKG
jgi:hypothetical protein